MVSRPNANIWHSLQAHKISAVPEIFQGCKILECVTWSRLRPSMSNFKLAFSNLVISCVCQLSIKNSDDDDDLGDSWSSEGYRGQTVSGGGKGACAPGGTICRRGHLKGRKWNSEIWPFLANCHLHCKQLYFNP